MSTGRPLHWGCGGVTPADWINSDAQEGTGIDISADIVKDGLPLKSASIPFIASHHALQQLEISDIINALRELHRVLVPGGVLRLGLPDFEKAMEAYQKGDHDYYLCWDWKSDAGNFIAFVMDAYMMDHNYTRTPMIFEFAEELLEMAGFVEVHRLSHGETQHTDIRIVELDNRPKESFYIEAVKNHEMVT